MRKNSDINSFYYFNEVLDFNWFGVINDVLDKSSPKNFSYIKLHGNLMHLPTLLVVW